MMRNCGCGAKPGELHDNGCDVERCCLCGGQTITCPCVYVLAGIDVDRMTETHPEIYTKGPTDAMYHVLTEEENKYGGRLPWTGNWPGRVEAREFGLYVRWADPKTGKAYAFPDRRGTWVPCAKDHPDATESLDGLRDVARWDKVQRRWVALSLHAVALRSEAATKRKKRSRSNRPLLNRLMIKRQTDEKRTAMCHLPPPCSSSRTSSDSSP